MWTNFKAWINAKLVPQWRIWWKLHSIQLGIVVSAAFSAFLADPSQLVNWINQLPPAIRDSLPYWVGPLAAVLIFLARFWDQHKSLLSASALQQNPIGAAAIAIDAVKGLEAAAKTSPIVIGAVTGVPTETAPPKNVEDVIAKAKVENGDS